MYDAESAEMVLNPLKKICVQYVWNVSKVKFFQNKKSLLFISCRKIKFVDQKSWFSQSPEMFKNISKGENST